MHTFKKTLILASISTFFAVPVFAAGKGATPNGKPFVELQGQILQVEGEISSLQDQIDSLVTRVDSIEERVGANESAIISLQTQNSNLKALIEGYGTDLTALQLEVQTLQSVNADLQALVDTGDTLLQAQIDQNAAMITSLQQTVAKIGDLQSQIDNNLALISTMQQEINTINELIQTKQDILDGKCSAGYALREINSDGSIVCEFVEDGGESGSSSVKLDTVLVQTTVDVPTNGWMSQNVWCPTGYKITGGGFNVFHTEVYRNHSYGLTGWHFNGLNNNNYKNFYIIYANCMKLM